jgi:hypothetical protein
MNHFHLDKIHTKCDFKIVFNISFSYHRPIPFADQQPMLPHEILLRIAQYIEDGSDFMNWIQALKKIQYPSLGDLGLILDLQELTNLNSSDMWPCLYISYVAPSEEIALMIANVCQFFKKIDCNGIRDGEDAYAWHPVYISKAITSLKPWVSARIKFPINDVPLTILGECKITEFGVMTRKYDDFYDDFYGDDKSDKSDESEVDDGSAETLDSRYRSLCENLKNIQGLDYLILCELPSAFLDTFFQQMHSFGISKLKIDIDRELDDNSIDNLVSALRLKKLKTLCFGGCELGLIDMQLLSPTFGLSQLKELSLFFIHMDDDEIKPIIQSLTDGLVNSIVEIFQLSECFELRSEDIQYLMENLCNMKSLKKLDISEPTFNSSDIPFLVQCARETTADIFIRLKGQPSMNLQDLVRMGSV